MLDLNHRIFGAGYNSSFCNGAFIVRPRVTVGELVQAWKDDESNTNRNYATFKIYDRKNNANVETSCGPEFLT